MVRTTTQSSTPQAAVRLITKIPANLFLLGSLTMAAASLGLMASGRKHASLLAGMAVPSILLVGLYQQLQGGRQPGNFRPDLH